MMFIHELTGYKANPIYQTATSTFVQDENPGQNSKTTIRKNKMKIFTTELVKYGFHKVGSGSFGFVYSKPGYPWLFKIFNTDPAYLAFLKWAITHQDNPHAPKIKGKIIKINDDTYAIRIEQLKPFRRSTDQLYNLQQIFEKYLDSRRKLTISDRKWFEINFPDMLEVIDAMKQTGYHFDIHIDNIMLRGKVPVITDPIYSPKNME